MPYIFLVYGMASVCLLIVVFVARESLIRLSLAHIRLDFVVSARTAIDRSLHLQLGIGLFVGSFRGRDDARRTNRLFHPCLFHLAGGTDNRRDRRRSIDPDWNLFIDARQQG